MGATFIKNGKAIESDPYQWRIKDFSEGAPIIIWPIFFRKPPANEILEWGEGRVPGAPTRSSSSNAYRTVSSKYLPFLSSGGFKGAPTPKWWALTYYLAECSQTAYMITLYLEVDRPLWLSPPPPPPCTGHSGTFWPCHRSSFFCGLTDIDYRYGH